MTSVLVEVPSGSESLAVDMSLLAEEALPPEFARWPQGDDVPYFFQLDRPPTADIIFLLDQHRFYCHQVNSCFVSTITGHILKVGNMGQLRYLQITLLV